jgi:DNA polymerase elongation subunit (family B)/DNA-directed RNA polymerase subunit RPC12/RpoP
MTIADDLREARKTLETPARILTFDIETSRAIVEVFGLFKNDYISIDRVKMPSRILCYSARWLGDGEEDGLFGSSWEDGDEDAYKEMVTSIWELLDSADMVVTWNGDRFDNQWIEAEANRLGLSRPAPYKSVDLMKIQKRHFKAGIMSQKLQWSARHWLRDSKTPHGGRDLWDDIRYGSDAEKATAQAVMKEYCEHDTKLTQDMLFHYLPYIKVNTALYRHDPDDEVMRCTKCGKSGEMHIHDKPYYTGAFAYNQYRCGNCGSLSRGKRNITGTELRSV